MIHSDYPNTLEKVHDNKDMLPPTLYAAYNDAKIH